MIRCTANGKRYIGSAVNYTKRVSQHLTLLRSGKHYNVHLQRAWTKHGEARFTFSPLVIVSEVAELLPLEQQYIDSYRAADPARGFNIQPTAGSNLGRKFSSETRAKNSAARLGKPLSEEIRRKQSAALAGKKKSAAHAAAISAGKIGGLRPDIRAWAPQRFSKFDAETVLKMRSDRSVGMTYQQLADKYGCNPSTAHSAVLGIGAFYSKVI